MTVAQNIASGVKSKNRAQRARIVAEKAAAFHLAGLEHKKPGQISGGEQQRAALARILVNEPEILLLDEPFSALDDYLKWQLELELSARLHDYGGAVLFVSHNRDEIYRMCGSVCVLSRGQSEPKRGVKELFESPGTLSASLISGCKNYSRVSPASDTAVSASDWGATLETGRAIPPGAGVIGVRAHYITPAKPGDCNIISCRVIRVAEDVFSTIVMLETPGGGEGYSRLRMELSKDEWLKRGNPGSIDISIKPKDIMLLSD